MTPGELLGQLDESIGELEKENDQLRYQVSAKDNTIVALENQLAVARRTFGEAFTKGDLAIRGEKRPNRPKLSYREVADIRAAFSGGMSQADLARSYGVHPATISRTVRRVYHS
ncbi:helix-turn-helix DNA-binding domain protein [Gordonia phage Nedarya]|nr:helix-turn-helix DNA-binding domain protein [Gordonia phage Nedarya]